MARRGGSEDTPSEEAVEHDFSMPADSDLISPGAEETGEDSGEDAGRSS